MRKPPVDNSREITSSSSDNNKNNYSSVSGNVNRRPRHHVSEREKAALKLTKHEEEHIQSLVELALNQRQQRTQRMFNERQK